MGEPENNYVCWFDVMGTRNQMLRSLPTSANFICKLHCAVLEAYEELGEGTIGVCLYPVMDGVYITSASRDPLMALLSASLRHLAETFLQEETVYHRFLVRGAIAFGPVVHGLSVRDEASWVLSRHRRERDSILMGMPMAQAYQAEAGAPPYGIAIHESARAFAPENERPFRFIWWDWYSRGEPRLDTARMVQALNQYFDWHVEHTNTTGYDAQRIEHHRALVREYFGR